MKVGMMVVGGILVAFGLVDLIGSFTGFDVWAQMGVQLPEVLWNFSAYIELAGGFYLFKAGRPQELEEEEEYE